MADQTIDTRVWRVAGSPLQAGAGAGPLAGHTVAVKDLFAIAGQRVGVGSRAYLAEAPVETVTAPAVQALLDAGADVVGIAQTDQFAYSIAGINADYGTPPNPAAPGAIPGGSSSGPASAVAQCQASVGVGSDTAGSIRVPASYQGLWGLRTTLGAVSLEGVAPLAPRYDTVGWLTRDGATLSDVAQVGLAATPEDVPRDHPLSGRAVTCPGINAAATDETRGAVAAVLSSVIEEEGFGRVTLPGPRDLFEAFRVTQSAEAWRSHGAWVDSHPGALGPDIEARFAWARAVTAADERAGLHEVSRLASWIDRALGDDVLVLPSAASAAPRVGDDSEKLNMLRESTLGMTAVAGLTGRPALSVPLARTDAGPVGVCLVGPRGSDLALIDLGLAWAPAGGKLHP
ncbi:amidase family protein [Demequina sp.]|uniref:amidase family protein n=1 Tax=Demequina sp. TaxID=2050685 RepID=UPI0025B909AA|nr:amidase family protein [Demequina sp.]